MRIDLPYGGGSLPLELDDGRSIDIHRAARAAPLADPAAAVLASLESPIGTPPLAELAKGRKDAVVVINDITRPVPNRLILPPILETLRAAGLPDDRIEILVATGTHRANTREELEAMVGSDILDRHPWRNHDATGEKHGSIGEVSPGVPVHVDSGYLATDLRVITGLIQPHLLAGYSGGRKAVVPGLVDIPTLKILHGYSMVGAERTAYGCVDGNPFHEAALAGAKRAGVDFMLNVTLDPDLAVTGVFGGDLEEAHRAGWRFVAEQVCVAGRSEVDVGIASGGGEPMDLTLYQSIKGLVALKPFVRRGGRMLLVARCAEGAGPADFSALLLQATHPGAFLRKMSGPDFFRKDQWMIQELCELGRTWKLHTVAAGLDARVLPAWVTNHGSVEEATAAILGDGESVVVLPDGPRDTPLPVGS